MQQDAYARMSVHPDLALLECTAQGPICCLALEGAEHGCSLAGLQLAPFCVYRQENVSALLFERPQKDDWQDMLEEALRRQGLTAGLSGPFALPASAHGCMRKAQLALKTGRRIAPGRALYPMDEYGEAALLEAAADVLTREGFLAQDFCDASIAEMARLDAQTGTQYASSLETYLNHGLDMKRAAQALGVHRNTLDYRMKRVQELFALDLTDVNTCFELLFSFWLRDHLTGGEAAADGVFDAQAAQALLWRHVERGNAGRGAQTRAQFMCRLLCVGVSRLPDAQRIALLQAMRALMGDEGACAFDEDVLFFALAPERMEAFAAACRPLCDERKCQTALTQAFDCGRIAQRAWLCRLTLCAATTMHARTQDMCSTLFFMTLEKRISLAPYLREDVIRVMDDDAMRGAALSRSLYAYLLHFRDMKKAAAQLGIHRNTMEYQMRKIDAIIGKTESENARFLMMCTFKMLALPEAHRFGL